MVLEHRMTVTPIKDAFFDKTKTEQNDSSQNCWHCFHCQKLNSVLLYIMRKTVASVPYKTM